MTTPSTTEPSRQGSVRSLRRTAAGAASALGRWSWPAQLAAVLGAATLLARAPGLVYTGLFDRDEAYLSVMGRVVGDGGRLYVDVIDRKPPLVPYAYRLAEALSADMRLVRFVVALAVLANGVLVAVLVRRLTDHRRAALAAGLLAVLGTALFLPADAQAANFELWGLAPATGAVLAAVWAREVTGPRWRWFALAGVLAAIALNCKQPFVVVLVPVGLEALRSPHRRANVSGLAAGTGAVVLAMGLLVDLPLLWRWGWADNGDYLDGGLSLARAAGVAFVLTFLFVAFHWPLFYGLVDDLRRKVRPDATLLLWLVVSAAVVPIGLRFFGHYYQQAVPPLAALTGVALARSGRRALTVVCGGALAMAVGAVGLAFTLRADLPDLTALHRYVEDHTEPDDRVLVWGAMPDAYVAADRDPAGVFLHGGYLTGNWASRSGVLDPSIVGQAPYRQRWAAFLRDVLDHPPALIIDAARPGTDWAGYRPGDYPIGELMSECYQPAARVDGLMVWRRDLVACPEAP